MMSTDLDTIRERLVVRDPDELVDILGITSEELLDAFHEHVVDYMQVEFSIDDDKEQDL